MKIPAFVVLALSGSALGHFVEFRHTGFGSGTLDGVPFGPTTFTLIGHGNNDSRTSFFGGFSVAHDHSHVMIEGLGMFDFQVPTRTFVSNTNKIVGFSRAFGPGFDLINGPTDNAFTFWDMMLPIGPISGDDGKIIQWVAGDMQTSGGILVLQDATDVPMTFEMTMVPTPGVAALLALCVLAPRRRRGR